MYPIHAAIVPVLDSVVPKGVLSLIVTHWHAFKTPTSAIAPKCDALYQPGDLFYV